MSDNTGGFGQLSLFLTLAFVLPAIVYIGFIFLFFRTQLIVLIRSASSWAPTSDLLAALAGLGIVFFVGILLTSISLAVEYLLIRNLPRLKSAFPKIEFSTIAVLQVGGKQVSYLLQLAGQAIMHFNIGCGVLILVFVYIANVILNSQLTLWMLFSGRMLIAIVVIAVNFYASHRFFNMAAEAVTKSVALGN